MTLIRLWVLVLIASGVSWVILRILKRPIHFGWVFLFWVMAILGSTAFLYMVSVWFVSQQ